MSNPRLSIERAARIDVEEARRWYNERSAGLGDKFVAAVDEAIRGIAESPMLSREVAKTKLGSSVRRRLTKQFPYFVGYLATPEEIVVLAVGHLHRRPGYWLKRVERSK